MCMVYEFKFSKICFNGKVLYKDGIINIYKNQINMLLGKSGTGKTTLLNHLFYSYKNNCVKLDQSNSSIFDDLSVLDNICFNENINKSEVLSYLSKMKLDYLLDRKPKYLSAGERRIVLIIRAFFSDKDILLLDEPTNNVDIKRVDELKKLLVNISKRKTILIVTHDDRLKDISFATFTISNNEVKERDNSVDIKQNKAVFGNNKSLLELKAKNKFLRFNKLNFFVFLIYIFIISLSFLYIYNVNDKKNDHITTNQIDVVSSANLSKKDLIESGYLPTSIIKDMMNKKEEDVLKTMSTKIYYSYFDIYTLGFYIEQNPMYKSYLVRSIDISNSEIVYPIRMYYEIYYLNHGIYPNLTEYMTFSNTLIENLDVKSEPTKINDETFLLIESSINSLPNMKNLSYIILYEEEYDFFEVASSESFSNVLDYNLYVRSNETIDLYNKYLTYKRSTDLSRIIIVTSVLYIAMSVISLVIDLKRNKKVILALRNYGYEKENVIKIYLKNNLNTKLYYIFIILSICSYLTLYILSLNGISIYSMNIILVFFITSLAEYFIKKNIYVISANKIFNFGGIYNEI